MLLRLAPEIIYSLYTLLPASARYCLHVTCWDLCETTSVIHRKYTALEILESIARDEADCAHFMQMTRELGSVMQSITMRAALCDPTLRIFDHICAATKYDEYETTYTSYACIMGKVTVLDGLFKRGHPIKTSILSKYSDIYPALNDWGASLHGAEYDEDRSIRIRTTDSSCTIF